MSDGTAGLLRETTSEPGGPRRRRRRNDGEERSGGHGDGLAGAGGPLFLVWGGGDELAEKELRNVFGGHVSQLLDRYNVLIFTSSRVT